MLSGVTASLNNASGQAFVKGVLMINGTAGDDAIHLTQTNGSLAISGVPIIWTVPLLGSLTTLSVPTTDVSQVQINTGSGNDSVMIDPGITTQALVFAGNGTDNLSTGGSYDTFFAGTGADTFVAIGGSHNVIFGGVGGSAPDSFWYDGGATLYNVSATEQAAGMVHYFAGFATLFTGTSYGIALPFFPTNQLNGQACPTRTRRSPGPGTPTSQTTPSSPRAARAPPTSPRARRTTASSWPA